MKALLILTTLFILTSCATSSVNSSVMLAKVGKIQIYVSDYDYLSFYDGALTTYGTAKPIEFQKAVEKAIEWDKQAKEPNTPKFSKELDSWNQGNITMTFNYENKNSSIVLCGHFGSALQLLECEVIASSTYNEFLEQMRSAPQKLKELKEASEASKKFK